jgi:hypothetical protein
MARCPAHDDHTPSLSIEEHHGRVFLRCYAGCNWRDVAAALELRGLWSREPTNSVGTPSSWQAELQARVSAEPLRALVLGGLLAPVDRRRSSFSRIGNSSQQALRTLRQRKEPTGDGA